MDTICLRAGPAMHIALPTNSRQCWQRVSRTEPADPRRAPTLQRQLFQPRQYRAHRVAYADVRPTCAWALSIGSEIPCGAVGLGRQSLSQLNYERSKWILDFKSSCTHTSCSL